MTTHNKTRNLSAWCQRVMRPVATNYATLNFELLNWKIASRILPQFWWTLKPVLDSLCLSVVDCRVKSLYKMDRHIDRRRADGQAGQW